MQTGKIPSWGCSSGRHILIFKIPYKALWVVIIPTYSAREKTASKEGKWTNLKSEKELGVIDLHRDF